MHVLVTWTVVHIHLVVKGILSGQEDEGQVDLDGIWVDLLILLKMLIPSYKVLVANVVFEIVVKDIPL